ncbi:MAG: D-glycero-D-manno-heptose 1,7-bisphosphate phosphatase [Pyrinomonadaceae bacterium]|jgi:D-glycero-D-manno-heptose 1,7-bisphosphate phosphatase|nr:D-glycero-D-manno-heptose 1,7-bisphosphate phosphatase [Pyrinomonadaceae bacterium]
MKRAVFIDRDGTLSEEVGYINHPSRFRLFPYAAPAIKLLNESGWLAIVTTNQAGVARGYFSEDMIQTVHAAMTGELERGEAQLDAIYYCAHHPSVGEAPYRFDCDCRKPKPGLISRAAREFEIDLAASWMVGDRYSDVELARNAGVNSAFVLSGYGRGEWEHQRAGWATQPDLVAADLFAAVTAIVKGKTLAGAEGQSALSGGIV